MTHPKTLAVIRVFSSTDQKVLEKHAKIIEKLYGIPTRTYCIPNQPEGIANEEIAKDCVDRIVEQCLRAEKDGADAVLVSCAIDPALKLHARSAVSPYSAPEAAPQPWRSRWAAVSGF